MKRTEKAQREDIYTDRWIAPKERERRFLFGQKNCFEFEDGRR